MEAVNDRQVFVWSVLAAAVVALVVVGGDSPTYDVNVVRELAEAALSGAPSQGVARTPGAYLLALPWLITDTPAVLISNVLFLALIAVAVNRIAQPSRWMMTATIVVLAVGTPFSDVLYSGGVFMPYAAAILWGWVWNETRPWLTGVLWGVAGVARIWPLLLAFTVKDRRVVYGIAGAAGVLTAAGLMLPGVTFEGSVGSLFSGGAAFLPSLYNGSLAAWLTDLGPVTAVLVGAVVVLTVWRLGLGRVDDPVAWTLPAAVLASPVAWRTYLFVVAPVVLRRTSTMWLAAFVSVAPFIHPRALVTAVCLLALYAASPYGERPVVVPQFLGGRAAQPLDGETKRFARAGDV